jgi:hypothetical protein
MSAATRASIVLLQIWRSINVMKHWSGAIGTGSLIGILSLFASALCRKTRGAANTRRFNDHGTPGPALIGSARIAGESSSMPSARDAPSADTTIRRDQIRSWES